ncbi:MAG: 50S ribosomal protein L15e [Candidatus Aenigmarchaeota archaeon]|nr:50S ribosomal protein L15e [Candidatus Aenigmarchaeota archaeon]
MDQLAALKNSMKERTTKWRNQGVIVRIEKPTRTDRARSLGYRAKQGFLLARVRIKKGGRRRRTIRKGRKPTKVGLRHYTSERSKQSIAETRVADRFPNMEVLNSYYAGEDGKYNYYEVILVDPDHPVIRSDRKISWIARQRRRAYRGLTSAAKKSRGF